MELTYDKLTEIEKQIMTLVWKSIAGTGLLEQTFIEGLREIMQPTCTANERKFLDEIREKGEWFKSMIPGKDALWLDSSCIRQSDFESNLQELVDE